MPGDSRSSAPEPASCTGPCEPARCGAQAARARIALADLREGQTAIVREASLEPADAAVLRAMGLRLNTLVRLCRTGEPCIVSVLGGDGCTEGCRIGLARLLARRVVVEVV